MSSFAGDWPHLLIVCGQNRVFYLDYVSYALREIEMSQLDSKEVHCMEAFALEDFVAFGCSDGAVRLWHVLTGAVTKLVTNSSKPIVGMFSHYNEMGSFLTVVSEDGIFTKWRVHGTADPVVEIKEGKGNYDVLDMTFDSTEHTLILVTDKGVVVRDYYNNKELQRLKIGATSASSNSSSSGSAPTTSKTAYISLKYFAHTKFSGSSALALAKDGKTLAICNTQPGGSAATSSFASLIPMPSAPSASTEIEPWTILESSDFPKGDKDAKVKMLFFDVHPTNASLVFIATSAGLVSASIDPFSTPQFALIKCDTPPTSPNQPLASPSSVSGNASSALGSSTGSLGPSSAGSQAGGASSAAVPRLSSKTSSNSLQVQYGGPSKIFFVNENQIWNIASAAANERGGAVVSFPSLFVALPAGSGDVKIAMSASGQFLSVFYERQNKYDIFSVETKKVVETASRVLGIVWCQSREGPKMVKLKDIQSDVAAMKAGPPGSARGNAFASDSIAFLEGPPSPNQSSASHYSVTVTHGIGPGALHGIGSASSSSGGGSGGGSNSSGSTSSGLGASTASSGGSSGTGSASSGTNSFIGMGPGGVTAGSGGASGSANVVKKILGKDRASNADPAHATRKITLNVKRSGNASHETVATFDAPLNSQPKIFAGPLLGIDVRSEPDASTNITQTAANFQFYSWSGDKIGVAMPTPLDVSWDYASMKYCLFTYESHFCVFSVSPKFKLLAKVSDLVLSSLWFNGCLFYTTRTDVKCFFASAIDSREVVVSATPTDAFTSALLAKSQQTQENLNGCSIVELANDKLVLLTHDYRVVTIVIDNPLTQVYILAHAGKVSAAVSLANSQVHPRHHPALSKFLEARGRVDAAGQLSLSAQEKLQLYLRHSNLTEALEVFSAMVRQCRQEMNAEHELLDDFDGDAQASSGQKTLYTRQILAYAAHRISKAATAAGNIQLIGKVWDRLSRIEPTAYRHLALYFAQNGLETQLQDLYKKLTIEANRDPAVKEEIKFVAVHMSNKILSDSLLNASNSYAEYILSLHESEAHEAELIDTWNARIQTETDHDTLLSGLSSGSASTTISFSSIMKGAESMENARSSVAPMKW